MLLLIVELQGNAVSTIASRAAPCKSPSVSFSPPGTNMATANAPAPAENVVNSNFAPGS